MRGSVNSKKIIIISLAVLSFLIMVAALVLMVQKGESLKTAMSIETRIENSRSVQIGKSENGIQVARGTVKRNSKKIDNYYSIAKIKYDYDKKKDYVVFKLGEEEYKLINEEPSLLNVEYKDYKPQTNAYILYYIDKENNVVIENVMTRTELYNMLPKKMFGFIDDSKVSASDIQEFIR